MTWVNLDDLFPEHPKVLAAGGDAGWLYVCGLCFTNRNLTEGRIPKAMVPRLSDRKGPMRLARRLVEVGLWREEWDAFVIHDWEKYNEGAEQVKARKEQARSAARARWSGRPKDAQRNAVSNAVSTAHDTASAHAPPMPEQCDEHAVSMPSARAGAMPSHSSPTNEHRSSSSNGSVERASPEEEELGQEPLDPVAHVCRLVAERRHAKRSEPLPEGVRRERWLVEVGAKLRLESERSIRAMLDDGQTMAQIVDLLEPPPRAPAAEPSPYPAAGERRGPVWDVDENGFAVERRVNA